MKFSEKLQKLRKENNMNQEQLAEKLDVSRQSVSKWESGQTYPEMDKLLTMCKIFNVTLDDLTNDEVNYIDVKPKNSNVFTNLVDDIMYIIDKSITKFKNMNKKEKKKTIIALLVLVGVLLILRLPFSYINYLVNQLFFYLPHGFYFVSSTFTYLVNIAYIIIFIFTFLYIYKTYFLDKGDNKVEEKDTSTKEEVKREPIVSEPTNEEQIQEKHIHHTKNRNTLFNILGKTISFFTKTFLIIIGIPFAICLLCLFLAITIMILLLIKYKITYIGIIICILAAIILNVLIIKIIISLVCNNKVAFKEVFLTFIISLALGGVGGGITLIEFTNTNLIDTLPENNSYTLTTEVQEFQIKDNIILDYLSNEIDFKYDETLTDTFKIELSYYNDFNNVNIYSRDAHYKDGVFNFLEMEQNTKVNNLIKVILTNLKDKNIYDYSNYFKVKTTVYISSANYQNMKDNLTLYYDLIYDEEDDYEKDSLYERINELLNQIEILEQDKQSLKEKITELETKIQEYKDNLNIFD